jgi:hypothetical protein
MAGVVVPIVTGAAVKSTGHFSAAFVALVMVTMIGSASWIFLVGRVEPVDWESLESHSLSKAAAAAD